MKTGDSVWLGHCLLLYYVLTWFSEKSKTSLGAQEIWEWDVSRVTVVAFQVRCKILLLSFKNKTQKLWVKKILVWFVILSENEH